MEEIIEPDIIFAVDVLSIDMINYGPLYEPLSE